MGSSSVKGTIRQATLDDIPAIVKLKLDGSISASDPVVGFDPLPKGYYDAFERISSDPNNRVYVVELGGTVIATLQMVYITFLAGAGQEDLQIESVYVAKEKRGQGVGRFMMEWAINEGRKRNCRRVQLTSNVKRTKAHRFYQQLGFELSHVGAKLKL
jgi:GNAT superfamily N-acetyltransferase